MLSGADPFRSLLFWSHDPKTVKTRIKVITSSMPKPWIGVMLLVSVVNPRLDLVSVGVRPANITVN